MENKNTIKKELAELSPSLAKLDKKNSFKVPAGYFEQLQAQMMTEVRKEGGQESLEKVAPSLAKLDKKNSFKVPEGYFEELQEQVMAEVQKEAKPETGKTLGKRVSLLRHRMLPIAATIALVLAIVFLLPNKTDTVPQLADITAAEVDDYIAQYLDDMDEELLFEYSMDTETETDFFLQGLEEELLDEILEEYLDEIADEIVDEDLEGLL